MTSPDLIRKRLAQPIDWRVLEQLVTEILAQDDLPSLRGLGGLNDQGADAVQETFYENESRLETIVQITSQRAQVQKFRSTVNRLRTTGKTFDQLIVVYRHPVDSEIKRQIQLEGVTDKIAVDVRDEDYLVRHLGRKQNGLFVRYFGAVREQIAHFFDEDDPLLLADERLKRAVLATVGAYVIKPRMDCIESTLLDQNVLASLVASETRLSIPSIVAAVQSIMPGESVTETQVVQSVERLRQANLCAFDMRFATPTEVAIEHIGTTIAGVHAALGRMREQVIGGG